VVNLHSDHLAESHIGQYNAYSMSANQDIPEENVKYVCGVIRYSLQNLGDEIKKIL
jgi:hypothetical protein